MATILIVYDNAAARDMLCEILRSRGYIMRGKDNVQAGLDLINQQHPDLVICDHEPPTLDGIELLQTLRLDPATVSIPVIICTSQTDPQVRELALQLGVCAYINKPFDLHLLTEPIAARLNPESVFSTRSSFTASPTSVNASINANTSSGDTAKTVKGDSAKISGTSMAWSFFTNMVGE
jgi:CheY-like chemotaxis protein